MGLPLISIRRRGKEEPILSFMAPAANAAGERGEGEKILVDPTIDAEEILPVRMGKKSFPSEYIASKNPPSFCSLSNPRELERGSGARGSERAAYGGGSICREQ